MKHNQRSGLRLLGGWLLAVSAALGTGTQFPENISPWIGAIATWAHLALFMSLALYFTSKDKKP